MPQKTFDIPLKGPRSYIQGPDLFAIAYTELARLTGSTPTAFEISCHRLAHRQVELVWEPTPAPEDAFASGSYRNANNKTGYWFREVDAELTQRQPYPEDELVADMKFRSDGKDVTLEDGQSFGDMEIWVSMIKTMHQRLYPDAEGKWVFVRAKVADYVPSTPPTRYRAVLAAALGVKLTRNEIFTGSSKVGDVFFALMEGS